MRQAPSLISVFCLCIALFTGCKASDDNSDQKTLEDFASGTSSNNSCGEVQRNKIYTQLSVVVDGGTTLPAETVREYRPAVEAYFSGLPEVYADYFVNKLNGFVLLTDDVNFQALCATGQGMTEERKKDMASCMAYQTDGPFKSKLAIVHRISADAKALNMQRIRAGGVRSMGMVFAQFLARHDVETSPSMLDKGINVRFSDTDVDSSVASLKKELTSRFLADVAKSDGKYDMSIFSPILGNDLSAVSSKALALATSIDGNGKATGIDVLAEAGIAADKAQQFRDYVFAEAFDSAYCTSKTAASSKTNFARTMGDRSDNVFTKLEQAVMSHANVLANHFLDSSNGGDVVTNASFGLQGSTCPCCSGGNCSCGNCNCANGQCTCTGGSCTCQNCQPPTPAQVTQNNQQLQSAKFGQGSAAMPAINTAQFQGLMAALAQLAAARAL